jgi:restriction endonuclease S subunit
MIKIPKNETLWETITSKSGKTYIVTSNKERSTYFLYLVSDNSISKVAKGSTPPDLMKHIDKEDK